MANKIELRGVLDRSFGARWCLRGFASIGDLAKLSKADFDYQRNPNEKHVGELLDFYTKNFDNLFFPELTLCLSLDVIGATDEEDTWLNNGPLNPQHENYKNYWQHKVGGCFAKFYTVQGNSFRTASITLPDNVKCIYRIDGNHRLVAAETLLREYETKKSQGLGYDTTYVERQLPFCLIIFPKGLPWKQYSATYFANINFKALPLSAELNIGGIVKNDATYSDDVLFSDPAFGPSFVFCRKMCNLVRDDRFIGDYIGREGLCSFFQELGQVFAAGSLRIANVKDMHKLCETVYAELGAWVKDIWSTTNNNLGYSRVVKAAAFYYHWRDQKALGTVARKGHKGGSVVKRPYSRCARFLSWINCARVGQTIDMPLQNLLAIFDAIYDKLPKRMFLARWYPEASDEKLKADARYAALEKIAKDNNLELIDMEHRCRGAFSIRAAIDSEIPESDLFVADLTGVRPNVMVEIGMALHHLPKNRVLFYMQKADEVPGMKGAVDKPPFDLSGYSYDKIVDSSELERLVRPRIQSILNEMSGGKAVDEVFGLDAEESDVQSDDNSDEPKC